ncbi:A24 family peptidase (plasmid) [Embleya sp. NBC_00888]|uniref:A24 family peptidase n=1 Tax=Embleya sp. NBC_00888 TaxID=2975960 RepID=UPI002F91817A|nr:A24 family peptidase [Embleya sp. NBC_00888]
MVIFVAVFAAGAGLGSFVRSVVFQHAVPAGEPLRRACPGCGGAVPVPGPVTVRPLSARGRCRWCRVRLGPAPGVPEVSTGLGFVGAVAVAAPPWTAIAWCWLVPFAVALALVDAAVHRLPDRLVLVAGVGLVVVLAGVAAAQARPGAFVRAVVAGLVLGAFHLVPALVGGMGMGDVKLALVVGAALGWVGWSCVLVGACAAFVVSGVYAGVMLVVRRGGRGGRVPFGPFMIAGACVALAIGGT